MHAFSKDVVIASAKGRWHEIFAALAPGLSEAMEHPGRHVKCPVHGGENGFRLFPHYQEKGDGICNTCGARTNGIAMLMWVNDWSFSDTVNRVGCFLGIGSSDPVVATRPENDSFSGRLLFTGITTTGNGHKAYTVRLSHHGRSVVCFGKDLERALSAAAVQLNDNVILTRIATQVLKNRHGDVYKKSLWTVTKLETPSEQQQRLTRIAEETRRRRKALSRLWKSTAPLEWTSVPNPVTRYLAKRSIVFDNPMTAMEATQALRYAKRLEYVDADGRVSFHPGLVARVTSVTGKGITLHRTYLTENGDKADVATVKKLMPLPGDRHLNGAAIRLGPAAKDLLCVAEGIETALSVVVMTGLPCWSCISAVGLRSVDIPDSVKTVFIFADKDKSETGAKAAESLRSRLQAQGRLAVIMTVPDAIPENAKGIDWNDMLRLHGKAAAPMRISA